MKKGGWLILLLIIFFWFFLRIRNLSEPYLWQDEAESAIYAFQILDQGYHHSEFRGETLYENKLIFLSDGGKYQYQSTNFFGSRYEKNKGWLPYYLMALSFKVLGASNFSARLPSVLISVLTIILVFFLTKEFFSIGLSLSAAFLYAINYAAIYYERQARYYSLEIFLVIINLYLFYLFLKTKKDKFLFLTSVGLILLFYTHIVIFLTLVAFLAGYYFCENRNFLIFKNKIFWLSAAVFLVLTIPWLYWVKFSQVSSYAFSRFRYNLLMLFFISLNLLILAAIKFLYQYLTKKKFKLNLQKEKFFYLIFFLVLSTVMISLILPGESLASRAFVICLPFLTIFLAYYFFQIFSSFFAFKNLVLFGLFFVWFIFLFSTWGLIFNQDYNFDWIKALVDYLKSENISADTLILSAYEQFPLMFYTKNPVQAIWPLSCEFLKNYPQRLIFVRKVSVPPEVTGGFFFGERASDKFFELFSCFTYNKNCLMIGKNGVIIYDCLAKGEEKN